MLRLLFIILMLSPLSAAAQDAPVAEMSSDTAARTPPQEEETPQGYYDVAILQGLNKVTARISRLEATLGTAIQFGNLQIVVQRCWKAPASALPENAARMEIIDRRPGDAPEVVFNGWMFSSSPSLAGLEHPVYDIMVLACERRRLGEEG
ncbi:MAG: DUF2155 domain-containing protein [Alphaproteobacteria bacterium]|nr:DUF2155 domain-containing protein [Alphaproteobacteria bacterium]